jgi:membrane-associated phospholipid phosphatase
MATGLAALLGSTAVARAAPPKLEWRDEWTPARGWNWALTGTLTGTALTAQLTIDAKRTWTGGVLFDPWVRDAVRAESVALQDSSAMVSNGFYFALFAYPFVVDSAVVAWGVHRSPRVAWQTFSISAEALAVAGGTGMLSQTLVGRQRPRMRGCEDRPESTACDDSNSNQSFFSGHTALAFASAGVICTHQREHQWYGRGWGALVCSLALTSAGTVGYLRIVSDNHYATDVLTGAAVGLGAGMLMPRWLHYGAEHNVTVVPVATADVQGLAAVVAF